MSDVQEWAKGQYRPSRACETCVRYPEELLKEIREFEAMKRAVPPETRCSYKDFRDKWLKPRGYDLSNSALYAHIKNCIK